ncbi:MAG: hypothetical protein Aurels2KO_22780 [Aureliella sp.]
MNVPCASVFRFSIRALILVVSAVAVLLAVAANRAREIARFNERLAEFVDECHAERTCEIRVQDGASPGVEWFVGGNPRMEICMIGFTNRSDPARTLQSLSDLGIRKIGLMDYTNGSEELGDGGGLRLLPKFKIRAITINFPMTAEQMRPVSGQRGLNELLVGQDYEASWLTDDLVSHMAPNPTLVDIQLNSELLTDACLEHFDKFPKLERIKVDSYQVDYGKIRDLQAKLDKRWRDMGNVN